MCILQCIYMLKKINKSFMVGIIYKSMIISVLNRLIRSAFIIIFFNTFLNNFFNKNNDSYNSKYTLQKKFYCSKYKNSFFLNRR
jgi:hypothetical protein